MSREYERGIYRTDDVYNLDRILFYDGEDFWVFGDSSPLTSYVRDLERVNIKELLLALPLSEEEREERLDQMFDHCNADDQKEEIVRMRAELHKKIRSISQGRA